MKIRRLLTVALAAGTLLAGASVVASSAPASAHAPAASSTCSTLTVNLKNYSVGDGGTKINTVRVEVDKKVVAQADFGASFAATYPLGDTTVAHDYVVTIDAAGTKYDRAFSGTSVPCVAATTPDANAALAVVPAACDVDGSLVLGEVKHATWGTPSAVTGPAPYSVTATAVAGHTFADGNRTKTFTGTLEGALDTNAPPCAPVVVVPDRPLPVKKVVDTTAVDCDSASQTTTTTTTTSDWALDTASNTWMPTPPVVTTTAVTVAVMPAACASEVPPTTTPPTSTPPGSTPPASTPPTPVTPSDVTTRAVPVEALAYTGSDAGAVVPIAGGLLLAGAALMIARRITATRATARD
jgi:hypothetical protein